MQTRRYLMLGVASLLLVPMVARATTVRRVNTAELAQLSQVIVQGTVVANEVVYDEGPNGPANVRTITTIEVTRSLKGDVDATVTVAGFGGQVGNFIYNWPGVPKFKVGDETIVFLTKPPADQGNLKSLFAALDTNGAGHLMVVGFEQGRLSVTQDSELGTVVSCTDEGLEFVGEVTPGEAQTPRLLEDVVAEIEGIVEVQRVEAERIESAGGGK